MKGEFTKQVYRITVLSTCVNASIDYLFEVGLHEHARAYMVVVMME